MTNAATGSTLQVLAKQCVSFKQETSIPGLMMDS
jgi:hypothetical protein